MRSGSPNKRSGPRRRGRPPRCDRSRGAGSSQRGRLKGGQGEDRGEDRREEQREDKGGFVEEPADTAPPGSIVLHALSGRCPGRACRPYTASGPRRARKRSMRPEDSTLTAPPCSPGCHSVLEESTLRTSSPERSSQERTGSGR